MTVLTVSTLNTYIRYQFETDAKLKNVFLQGEISNYTDHYRSGHLYLSLKDEKSVIKAVMFSGNASRLRFRPENGMKVLVRGRVGVYEPTGQYQFYIEEMQPYGAGAAALAFEQLKAKLEAQGLFAASRKKPLPAFPEKIGVITSPTGAALQDICRILSRRYPIAEVTVFPAQVQGERAASELIRALRQADASGADVLIIGRGGGASEDLSAFNDEALVRAVAACRTPIVSGVGHETDVTLCDFAADVRASTPSAAAELVSPDRTELLEQLSAYRSRLRALLERRVRFERMRLETIAAAGVLSEKTPIFAARAQEIDRLSDRLFHAGRQMLTAEKQRLASLAGKADALSPLRRLEGGYALAMKDGRPVTRAAQAEPGEELTIRFLDGELKTTVKERSLL